jgi:hypothetical protein
MERPACGLCRQRRPLGELEGREEVPSEGECGASETASVKHTNAILNSTLAALAAGFRRTLAVFGEVAAATPVPACAPLTHVAVLGLLLPAAAMLPTIMSVVAVLVALLAGHDVLFVGSALIGHIEFSVGSDFSSGVNSRTRWPP